MALTLYANVNKSPNTPSKECSPASTNMSSCTSVRIAVEVGTTCSIELGDTVSDDVVKEKVTYWGKVLRRKGEVLG